RKGNELVEAGKMLELGYKHDLFARSDLEALKEYAEKKKPTFDQYFSIKRERVGDKFLDEYEIIVKQVPRIRRDLENGCFVEVEREHRQKAVGYQSMLYIYIPIKNVDPPLVGRHARPKEVVKWYPTKKDIEGIIKTFSIISEMHKGDIVKIISKLLETK
ncbi:MAG: R.Pab1 family restriction endonuclease, partial [Archaeoglobaceae archaeon]